MGVFHMGTDTRPRGAAGDCHRAWGAAATRFTYVDWGRDARMGAIHRPGGWRRDHIPITPRLPCGSIPRPTQRLEPGAIHGDGAGRAGVDAVGQQVVWVGGEEGVEVWPGS